MEDVLKFEVSVGSVVFEKSDTRFLEDVVSRKECVSPFSYDIVERSLFFYISLCLYNKRETNDKSIRYRISPQKTPECSLFFFEYSKVKGSLTRQSRDEPSNLWTSQFVQKVLFFSGEFYRKNTQIYYCF